MRLTKPNKRQNNQTEELMKLTDLAMQPVKPVLSLVELLMKPMEAEVETLENEKMSLEAQNYDFSKKRTEAEGDCVKAKWFIKTELGDDTFNEFSGQLDTAAEMEYFSDLAEKLGEEIQQNPEASSDLIRLRESLETAVGKKTLATFKRLLDENISDEERRKGLEDFAKSLSEKNLRETEEKYSEGLKKLLDERSQKQWFKWFRGDETRRLGESYEESLTAKNTYKSKLDEVNRKMEDVQERITEGKINLKVLEDQRADIQVGIGVKNSELATYLSSGRPEITPENPSTSASVVGDNNGRNTRKVTFSDEVHTEEVAA